MLTQQRGEGLQFHCSIRPPTYPTDIYGTASAAQEAGFDRIWLPDQGFHCDPFVLLSRLASVSDIPLGLAITNPFSRHPVQIARAIAGLKHLYPGTHWAFAIGASNPISVLNPLGLTMRNSAKNIGAAVDAIKRLLRGEQVTVDDEALYFSINNVKLNIDPVEDVSILIGTRGAQTLRQAGKTADGVIVESMYTEEGISWAKSQIREGAEDDCTRQSLPYIAWQITEIGGENRELSAAAQNSAKMFMRTTHPDVLRILDFPQELIDSIKTQDGAAEVPEWALRKFVATGTPTEIQARIEAASKSGADAWSCTYTATPDLIIQQMNEFGSNVIQPLRAKWQK